MINLIGKHVRFTTTEKKYLKTINFTTGNAWGISSGKMKEIKKKLKDHLNKVQDYKCAYCSTRLYVGGNGEIEHIVPKGPTLYPEFTFHELNLLLACEHCNGFLKKVVQIYFLRDQSIINAVDLL